MLQRNNLLEKALDMVTEGANMDGVEDDEDDVVITEVPAGFSDDEDEAVTVSSKTYTPPTAAEWQANRQLEASLQVTPHVRSVMCIFRCMVSDVCFLALRYPVLILVLQFCTCSPRMRRPLS